LRTVLRGVIEGSELHWVVSAPLRQAG